MFGAPLTTRSVALLHLVHRSDLEGGPGAVGPQDQLRCVVQVAPTLVGLHATNGAPGARLGAICIERRDSVGTQSLGIRCMGRGVKRSQLA